MKIQISPVFMKDEKEAIKKEIKVDNYKCIKDVIEEIGIINIEYANFILNGEIVEISTQLKEDDNLIVMPIFSGG